eukprot:CAMPEP_0171437142 /NCGR_PEP_ID=MMETSP0881-20121228/15568_1 /TAXON_ID=67004 /ORGANISM="Thalassiosira weissflogii, Strain CCMP1336" /LENGTH=464 /DNA_ID=CAMNT_0011958667 /DNA_START=251 /DNA_END=1642 /DNA_ORIENTATION=+
MSTPNDDDTYDAGGVGVSTPGAGSGVSVNYDNKIDQTLEEQRASRSNYLRSGAGNREICASGLIQSNEEIMNPKIKEEIEKNSRRDVDVHTRGFEIQHVSYNEPIPPELAAANARVYASYDHDITELVGGEAGCDNDHQVDINDCRYSEKSSNHSHDADDDNKTEEAFTEEGIAMAKNNAGDDDRPNAKPHLHRNKRFKAYGALGLVSIAVIATVVVVVVTKKLKEKYASKEVFYVTPVPKQSPTMAPTMERDLSGVREFLEKNVLVRNATYDNTEVGVVNGTIGNATIGDGNSTPWNKSKSVTTFADLKVGDPRLIALDWILHKDVKQLEVYDENLSQRYILGLLAMAWDSESWDHCGAVVENTTEVEEVDTTLSEDSGTCFLRDNETDPVQTFQRWLSDADECDWFGVACNDGHVISIELAQNNLIGEIVPELGMLPFLQIIDLSSNCIYGTLPSSLGRLSI